MEYFDLIVIGGGAAGFFSAITAAKTEPSMKVLLLERGSTLLGKVRISGGGRCNVTHACFDPLTLVKHYPRGGKELIGPFHRFQPKDTIDWFFQRGVLLKTEKDGRVFPKTDQSQTIIDCLLKEAEKGGIEIRTKQKIKQVKKELQTFKIILEKDPPLFSSALLIATGSHPSGWALAKQFGHGIVDPIPSLFTLNMPHFALTSLAGVSVPEVVLTLSKTAFSQKGPLLITHFGFSGPAALKLSAWGAKELFLKGYQGVLEVDWLPDISWDEVKQKVVRAKQENQKSLLKNQPLFSLPKSLWKKILERAGIQKEDQRIDELNQEGVQKLVQTLKRDRYSFEGKTTHKEEFVTCGGIALKEVDFKKMESKLQPGLYFSGEILDIDAVTGGFNFQNAWTTGWIAGNSIGHRPKQCN